MRSKRDGLWLLGALAFGAAGLPWLVYYAGLTALGPYANGGAGRFFADYLADLLHGQWVAWALALGPLAVTAVWRVITRVGTGSASESD